MRMLLKKQSIVPEELVTDRLRAYGAAMRELGLSAEHIQGKRKNSRRRARTSRSDDESARCRGFDRPDRPNVSSLRTPPSPTPSPPAVT